METVESIIQIVWKCKSLKILKQSLMKLINDYILPLLTHQ